MRSNIPDGVPAMFFLCYHKATSRAPFILGANQESWGGLEPIQTIRREDRAHRQVRVSIYTCVKTFQEVTIGKNYL